MRWPWSRRERRVSDDELYIPATTYPAIAVDVQCEMKAGSCGWWPRHVDNAKDRPGDYIRLTAGAYKGEAVEMADGSYRLVSGVVDEEPGLGVIAVPSAGEARRTFQRLVEKRVSEFAYVTFREID